MYSFKELCERLHEEGYIHMYRMDSEFVCVARPIKKWNVIAKYCSTLTTSRWLVRNTAVCNLKGVNTSWIMTPSTLVKVYESRETAFTLTGKRGGWSVASNAKVCWEWALPQDKEAVSHKKIMEGADYGAHFCFPGEFKRSWYLDMKSCYWRLLQRLESRRWQEVFPGKWLKIDETDNEKSRLQDLYQCLEPNKAMRNAVWGTLLGGVDEGTAWKSGVLVTTSGYPGLARASACFVARMAFELTLLQGIDSSAVYGQTDGIICSADSSPAIWDYYGVPWEVKAFGDADVRFQHSYWMPGHTMERYEKLSETKRLVDFPQVPERIYISEML